MLQHKKGAVLKRFNSFWMRATALAWRFFTNWETHKLNVITENGAFSKSLLHVLYKDLLWRNFLQVLSFTISFIENVSSFFFGSSWRPSLITYPVQGPAGHPKENSEGQKSHDHYSTMHRSLFTQVVHVNSQLFVKLERCKALMKCDYGFAIRTANFCSVSWTSATCRGLRIEWAKNRWLELLGEKFREQ